MRKFSARIAIRLSWLQVLLLALMAWFIFGEPLQLAAGLWYPDTPAPWESVDLEFQPDSARPGQRIILQDLHTLQECRNQARLLMHQQTNEVRQLSTWNCLVLQRGWFGKPGSVRLHSGYPDSADTPQSANPVPYILR